MISLTCRIWKTKINKQNWNRFINTREQTGGYCRGGAVGGNGWNRWREKNSLSLLTRKVRSSPLNLTNLYRTSWFFVSLLLLELLFLKCKCQWSAVFFFQGVWSLSTICTLYRKPPNGFVNIRLRKGKVVRPGELQDTGCVCEHFPSCSWILRCLHLATSSLSVLKADVWVLTLL